MKQVAIKDLPSLRQPKTSRMPKNNSVAGRRSKRGRTQRLALPKIVIRTKSYNHNKKKEVHGYTNSGFLDEDNKAIKLYYTNCGDIVRYTIDKSGSLSPYKNAKSITHRQEEMTCVKCHNIGIKDTFRGWMAKLRDRTKA